MIESKDISVVIQGGVNEYTQTCLMSLREKLPEAQLILSTWEESDVTGLQYDDLVISRDPGGIVLDDVSGTVNNINRQLVSTRAGLELVERKYCLKFRTDLVLNSSEFIRYFGVFDRFTDPLHFKNRVIVCNYYTRNPRIFPLPFHISDWIMFGNTEDIKLYFEIGLQSEEEIRWFRTHPKTQKDFYTNLLSRFVPEQYININFAKRFYEFECDCFYDVNIRNIKITEEIIARDFVVLDYKRQLDISFNKYNPNRYLEKFTLISHKDWKKLYKYYRDDAVGYSIKIWKIECKIKYYIAAMRRQTLEILHKMKLKEKTKIIMNRINLNE